MRGTLHSNQGSDSNAARSQDIGGRNGLGGTGNGEKGNAECSDFPGLRLNRFNLLLHCFSLPERLGLDL